MKLFENKKGIAALAQLALVLFVIVVVLTIVPNVKATLIDIINSLT